MKDKLNIGWGLTNSCNMHCKFCYSKETRDNIKECSIEDWKNFVDENYKKIESINYGTGENSLIDDFFYFVDYVRKNYPNIKQSLTTNGYIFNKVKQNNEFMRIYKESIDEIDVSLDFKDKEKHNYFRGQNEAYDWAINTLKMLKEDNKKVTVVFVGFEDTLKKENIDGLFEICKEYNSILRLNVYRPVSNNAEINRKFMLSYSTLIDALNYINDKYEIISFSDVLLGNILTDQIDIIENTGIGSIRILADGSICPSTYLIQDEYRTKYNIKQKDVLSNIKFKDFESDIIPEECNNCELKEKCKGGVYDRRILWYGTLKQRDPYCPIRLGKKMPKKRFNVTKKDRISVHDGYLPTMFFKNR